MCILTAKAPASVLKCITMHYLFIINAAPYGGETSYNALKLARSVIKEQ